VGFPIVLIHRALGNHAWFEKQREIVITLNLFSLLELGLAFIIVIEGAAYAGADT
jgi:hypothetical protein